MQVDAPHCKYLEGLLCVDEIVDIRLTLRKLTSGSGIPLAGHSITTDSFCLRLTRGTILLISTIGGTTNRGRTTYDRG